MNRTLVYSVKSETGRQSLNGEYPSPPLCPGRQVATRMPRALTWGYRYTSAIDESTNVELLVRRDHACVKSWFKHKVKSALRRSCPVAGKRLTFASGF